MSFGLASRLTVGAAGAGGGGGVTFAVFLLHATVNTMAADRVSSGTIFLLFFIECSCDLSIQWNVRCLITNSCAGPVSKPTQSCVNNGKGGKKSGSQQRRAVQTDDLSEGVGYPIPIE